MNTGPAWRSTCLFTFKLSQVSNYTNWLQHTQRSLCSYSHTLIGNETHYKMNTSYCYSTVTPACGNIVFKNFTSVCNADITLQTVWSILTDNLCHALCYCTAVSLSHNKHNEMVHPRKKCKRCILSSILSNKTPTSPNAIVMQPIKYLKKIWK